MSESSSTPRPVRPPTVSVARRGQVKITAQVSRQATPPDPVQPIVRQAKALVDQGRFHDAEQCLLGGMVQHPEAQLLRRQLSGVFLALSKHREALAVTSALVALRPDDEQLLLNHSTALFKLERMREAHMALEDLVQRFPANHQARQHLASIHLNNLNQPEKALEVLRPSEDQEHAGVQFALGCVHARLGNLRQALIHYERALRLQPGHAESLSNYLFTQHYLYPVDLARVKAISVQHGQAVQADAERLGWVSAAQAPTRRRVEPMLRVGLLSADLRQHPVGHFLESVLAALSTRPVTLFAYANQRSSAIVPPALRAAFSQWRDIQDETDERVAQQIAGDGLDVLLDLSGHTSGNRMGVLARRPAPRQVSWLGYFGTTGLPFIDAVITDPHCVPPSEEALFAERVLTMPHSRLCLTPPAHAPAVAPEPPMAALPWISFGCFQNAHKINDSVLALWKRVLDAVPASVLRLQNGRFDEQAQVLRMRERLQAAGIDLRRVLMASSLPREHYLGQYADIDVLLDTFPYPGGTTTAEAIWMGVPTLTLATPGMLGRQGQAMLENVGLGDWVAHSEDDYVTKAAALATDRKAAVQTLRSLRQQLRETARRSPLFDAATFAADLERLLRDFCAP